MCLYVAQVMYDRACKFWHFLFNIFQEYRLMNGRQWMQFYAAEQRFFRQMLMAAKVMFPQSTCFLDGVVLAYRRPCLEA